MGIGCMWALYVCMCVLRERKSRLIDESDPTLTEQHSPHAPTHVLHRYDSRTTKSGR